MIPRYSRPEMAGIWQDSAKFNWMLQVELLACEARCLAGLIPPEAMANIKQRASFDVSRILEIERVCKHDVIAFLTNIAENVGPDSRHIHHGLTSSDVLDTCFTLQLLASLDLIQVGVLRLMDSLSALAHTNKRLLCIGRTHGIHAEPTSVGLKFARFYAEFKRALSRLQWVRGEISVCSLSGAVGTYSSLGPEVELYVAEKLGLQAETISSQVIPRDRHAMFFAVMAVMAGSIENCAIEIRHLQKTEVGEVLEGFSEGQKGSSAMPHKRNPILSENLTGLSRLIRMSVMPALENIALWHERDISHSSVERVIAPDVCILVDFALDRLASLLDILIVDEKQIANNLQMGKGLFWSQWVLLKLVDRGISREESYQLVQSAAARVWGGEQPTFQSALQSDDRVSSILGDDMTTVLSADSHWLQNVDVIFDRVFGDAR